VPVGRDGSIDLFNDNGSVDLIADVQGYYTTTVTGGNNTTRADFTGFQPVRILDTRHGIGAGGPLGQDATVAVKVTGVDGIPAGASSVLVNLTGVAPTGSTWISAFGGGAVPDTSTIDLAPGETRPVLATVPVDADGDIHIHNNTGSIDVVADLQGYFG
jgi:hypothetical protein